MNNKSEIISTRVGGLGSSDAKMVAKIAIRGALSDADKQRIAIMLGLEELKQFKSIPTEYGNYIEEVVFDTLKKKYPNAVSNPFYKSEILSQRYGFGIFTHIDYEVETEDKITWIEHKTTKSDFHETLHKYLTQLAWHSILLHEKAAALGKQPVLILSHYKVSDYDNFEPQNLEIKRLVNGSQFVYYLPKLDYFENGLKIISDAVKDFNYEPREELYADNLPAPIQEKMQQIVYCLQEIKTAESMVEQFKERMKGIMSENNIKTIDNDYFRITLVKETMSNSFDKKAFEVEYPELSQKFTKQIQKSSYINIKIK